MPRENSTSAWNNTRGPTAQDKSKTLKKTKHNTRSLRFKIGIALLAINVPIGWGGMALCALLAAWTHRKTWLTIGFVLYAVSWALLGIGFILAGHGGWIQVRHYRKRRARLQHLLKLRADRKSES